MFYFIERLVVVAAESKIRRVYFHNLSCFDGILILKYFTQGSQYIVKLVIKNNNIYEIKVYQGEKLLFHLRDSLRLLPNSLDILGMTLCKELCIKGILDHKSVNESNLLMKKVELLKYFIQDIKMLGGIMVKAQELYWNQFKVDIEDCMSLSTLATKIFRKRYYDSYSIPIHIPSRNEDTFIQRCYYGGHTDTYIPHWDDLYYYDVNSLYPYIMKSSSMPGGVPVRHGNLEGQDLSILYGFIEAYVECLSTITRPFLPYKDKYNTLLFPTGQFVGSYFNEELIYARKLGYKIIPLRGYLFAKMPSPFGNFVTSLFEKRQEAKKSGNEAMSYVYKIIMNSLYRRFGINPKSLITEICDWDKYQLLS